jgi:hypothetical protein
MKELTVLSKPQPSAFRNFFIPALLIIAVGAFQIGTIRGGQGWGDDFAAYILQTKHMATDQSFVPYEFIPNPATMLGGQAYPPLLSVLLLPAYLISGLNLYPMKIIGIVCVLVALWLINLVFEDWLPLAWRCVLIVLVGICPRLFDMRDAIESEKPFLVFFFLTIYFLQRAYRGAPERPPTLRWSVLVGLSLFAAEATRNTGAALFPVVLSLDFFYFRRLTRFALLSVLIGAVPSGILSILLRTGGGYLDYYNFSPVWLVRSAYLFSKNSESLWWGLTPRWPGYLAAFAACLVCLWGLYMRLRQGAGVVEFATFWYLAIVLPYFAPQYWPYFVPVLPIYLAYILVGIWDIQKRILSVAIARSVIAAPMVAIVLLYAIAYARTDWGAYHEGISDPQFLNVCDFIRTHTQRSDVILFRKPRLLALLTERRASVYPIHDDRVSEPSELWGYASKLGAKYIIANDATAGLNDPDAFNGNRSLALFLEVYRDRLDLAYQVDHFRVYRLLGTTETPDFGQTKREDR